MNADLRERLEALADDRARRAAPDAEAALLWGARRYRIRLWILHAAVLAATALVGGGLVLAHPALVPVSSDLRLSGIAIAPAAPELLPGQEHRFTAEATYADGSAGPLTEGVTWSSSDAGVATVDGAGLVTAVAEGRATVTAAAADVDSSAVVVVAGEPPGGNEESPGGNGEDPDGDGGDGDEQGPVDPVRELTTITLAPSAPELGPGQTHAFAAEGRYSDGSRGPVEEQLSWSSADPAVATVDGTGVVTAAGPGETEITAAAGDVEGSAGVAVRTTDRPPELTALVLGPGAPELEPGQAHVLTAEGSYSDGSRGPVAGELTWTSADPAVATVDPSGTVTAVAPGRTTITAATGDVEGSAPVVVVASSAPELLEIALVPESLGVGVGENEDATGFTVNGTFSDGSSRPVTEGVSWTSDDPGVADVTETGQVIGRSTGVAVITAAVDGVTDTATVFAGNVIE